MKRSFCVLAALPLACVALAAPAPKPYMSDWGNPLDPDNDCKIRRGKDSLTIEMPGSDHDYDIHHNRVNAPRLLREFEGDFEIQLRVRIERLPSDQSPVKGLPSYVSAGFLIIPPAKFGVHCIRSEYRLLGQGDGACGCVADIIQYIEGREGRGVWDKRHPEWPFTKTPEYVYLRLERWGDALLHQISVDGKAWVTLGSRGLIEGLPAKLQVGLVACSVSSDPSKVQFDQIKLIPGKKRELWEFVSEWGNPVDPDKDCKIKRDHDAFTIEMPGTDHDYDPVRKRFNAPRLLSELEGNFDLEVRIRIDYRPGAHSTVEGQRSFVSAGFLLIYPEPASSICDRVEFALAKWWKGPARPGIEADSYAVMKTWNGSRQRKGRKIEWDRGMPRFGGKIWERGSENWPLPQKSECAYLRLEQRDEGFCFYISPDGEKWTALTTQPRLPANGRVGLAAYSTLIEPSKVRFDQLKLARNKKEGK